MNVVAHNIIALNAQRQFGIVTRRQEKRMEKLSSGYRAFETRIWRKR